jgi:hypothetical protein
MLNNMFTVAMAQVCTQTNDFRARPSSNKKRVFLEFGAVGLVVNLFVWYLINPYFSGYQP